VTDACGCGESVRFEPLEGSRAVWRGLCGRFRRYHDCAGRPLPL